MATAINAYLTFGGQAREAMTFYKEALGAELTLMTVKDTNMQEHCPGADENSIMHATLTKDSLVLMASDMLANTELVQGNNFSLSLNCSSEEEINHFFDRLSAGGQVIEPVKVQFWGALFGILKDKFGITWMLNYDKNPQQ